MEQNAKTDKELNVTLSETICGVNDATTDPRELYRKMRQLESRYRVAGREVPDVLKRLEKDFEREFFAASQGR